MTASVNASNQMISNRTESERSIPFSGSPEAAGSGCSNTDVDELDIVLVEGNAELFVGYTGESSIVVAAVVGSGVLITRDDGLVHGKQSVHDMFSGHLVTAKLSKQNGTLLGHKAATD
eukprot:TRINITY_DN9291_c0_g1_i1.p4 TRINITY_DN9291_c0_g1~~TRINITY_DN9291_c0_g1_i1.p4  ORF type:complete len:118 (-),score=4.76 TRINITY_DN9291_c0_g1_i1:1748-2101(-)